MDSRQYNLAAIWAIWCFTWQDNLLDKAHLFHVIDYYYQGELSEVEAKLFSLIAPGDGLIKEAS